MRLQIKRTLTAVLLAVFMATATAMAQNGLNIAKVFEKYGHAKGCKMVEMNDAHLYGHSLRVYKSLTYRHTGGSIEALMKEDRRKARKIREVVDNGTVTSGYYMMSPLDDGTNRYILFSKGTGGSGVVIYIEGRLSPDDIIQICYARKRR